jgi:hypothetical protein
MRKRIFAGAVLGLAVLALVPAATALADKPDNPNCWGQVTSQRASTQHDVGQHSSAQEEPRLGLGNVARVLVGEDAHVSDLGTVLAGLDEFPETSCP